MQEQMYPRAVDKLTTFFTYVVPRHNAMLHGKKKVAKMSVPTVKISKILKSKMAAAGRHLENRKITISQQPKVAEIW